MGLFKDRFAVGQRVRFRRMHDKATELTGTIVGKSEDDEDCVSIETDADGKKVEVSGVEMAHAADVVPLDPPAKSSAGATSAAPRGVRRVS